MELLKQLPRMVGQVLRSIKFLIWAVVLLAVCYTVIQTINFVRDGWSTVRSPVTWVTDLGRTALGLGKHDPSIPPEKAAPQQELDCLAAIIAIDSEGEETRFLGEVRREIAQAVKRLEAEFVARQAPIAICDIFAKAYTWVPREWNHSKQARGWWRDREIDTVKRGRSAHEWTQAQLLAREYIGKAPDPRKCATNYVRPKSHRFSYWSNEDGAASAMIAAMKDDPVLQKAGYRTRFLCPK